MDTSIQTEWSALFDKTLHICREDEHYETYSAREKMLAFVFTFLQSVSADEQKFSALLKQQRIPFFKNNILNQLQKDFDGYSDALIFDATNTGEVQARPFIANYYKTILWNAFVAVLYFWANDKSDRKENTDVMVEKTVHFAFDLLAPGVIDSGIDLAQNFFKLRR